MKKTNSVIWIVLIPFIVFLSCSHRKRIEHQISMMCKDAIRIGTNEMIVFNNSDSLLTNDNTKSDLKMVVWADSSECSQCYIRHLDLWKGYVKLESDNPNEIQFFFILETAPEKLEEMRTIIQTTQLKHSIYVDTAQCFRHLNPQIPADVMFHTFLLDSDNKVVLVGNPTRNRSIHVLFNKILNENLGIIINDEDGF